MLKDIRKLEEPKTMGECWKVFEHFGLVFPKTGDYIFENAIQLVQANNNFVSLIDKYKEALEEIKHDAELKLISLGDVIDICESVLDKE